ncbi:MAG: hypothetical protein P4M05_28020 [Bradyrhizobium sp.]|nr:hypothetical protein [Bradyrhizobium sp.]
MRAVTTYVADDGQSFQSREACEAHEASRFALQFTGLTLGEVEAALNRTNTKLADAFEVIGARIADTRRSAGEMRRKPKAGSEPKPAAVTAPETTEAAPLPAEPKPPVGKSSQVDGAPVGNAAFDKGRQAYREGKQEAIPGGLKESEWDDWVAGYAHESGRGELPLDGRAA